MFACDSMAVGRSEETGRWGPTWYYNGRPCTAIGDDPVGLQEPPRQPVPGHRKGARGVRGLRQPQRADRRRPLRHLRRQLNAADPGDLGGEPEGRHRPDRRPVDGLVDAHADLRPALADPEEDLQAHDRGQEGHGRQPRLLEERPRAPQRRRHERGQRVGERPLVVVRDDERRVDRQNEDRSVEVSAHEARQAVGDEQEKRNEDAEGPDRHDVRLVVEQVAEAEGHAVDDAGDEVVGLVRHHHPPDRDEDGEGQGGERHGAPRGGHERATCPQLPQET